MTWTIDPDRPVTRVANLAARGGFRDAHWRRVRRRLDPCDVTPLDAEPPRPLSDRIGEWYHASRWAHFALGALGGVLIAASFALMAMALADWILR